MGIAALLGTASATWVTSTGYVGYGWCLNYIETTRIGNVESIEECAKLSMVRGYKYFNFNSTSNECISCDGPPTGFDLGSGGVNGHRWSVYKNNDMPEPTAATAKRELLEKLMMLI